jgi:hypothetical protein
MVFNATFKQYFNYNVDVNFIGAGHQNTGRKPHADLF